MGVQSGVPDQVNEATPALQVPVCLRPHSLYRSLSIWKGYFVLAWTKKNHICFNKDVRFQNRIEKPGVGSEADPTELLQTSKQQNKTILQTQLNLTGQI